MCAVRCYAFPVEQKAWHASEKAAGFTEKSALLQNPRATGLDCGGGRAGVQGVPLLDLEPVASHPEGGPASDAGEGSPACGGGQHGRQSVGRMLRLLQEKEYRPLGSTKTRKASVRMIAATNADLEDAVQQGRLRRDLYYGAST